MYPSSERRFIVINYVTIITLFVLILAGGIVRSSGSGMGCPDWPKCFGSYIPPTSESQLPAGYKDKYVQQRVSKNERFAKALDLLGYSEMANDIRGDKSILVPEDFNVGKTWTEYINRLAGAITGFFLLGCVFFSVTYLKSKKRIFLLSVLNLVLVGFQAWLGSIVVSTNLLAWVVTVHMLVAFVIICISIYTYFQARILRDRKILATRSETTLRVLALFALVLTIIQVVLGTEVREQIDMVSSMMNYINRQEWVERSGQIFNFHRDLAILVLVINGVLFFMVRRKYALDGLQYQYALYIILIIVMQILTGISLAYFAMPAMAQALHILIATLLFGAQLYLLLLLKQSKLYNRK